MFFFCKRSKGMFFCGGKRTKNARGFRFPRTPKTTAPRGGSSLWGRCALRRRREERGGVKVFARRFLVRKLGKELSARVAPPPRRTRRGESFRPPFSKGGGVLGRSPEPLSAHMKYAAFGKRSVGESPIVQRFFSGASLCESRKRTSSFLHTNFG